MLKIYIWQTETLIQTIQEVADIVLVNDLCTKQM